MLYNLDIKTILLSLISIILAGYLIYYTLIKFTNTQKQFNLKTLNKIRNRQSKKSLFIVKRILLLSVLIFLVITILRPKWGIETEKRESLGIDIVFSLDISESMRALDFSDGSRKVNRLETAKEMITNFVQSRPGDRFSLVVFAGEAFVSCPLTTDHNAFVTFLNSVSFDEVSVGGTNLNEALKASLGRFIDKDGEQKRSRAIILITDGEDQDSNYDEVINIAKEDKVQIFTVGLGSKDGSLIPIGNDVFGRQQYKEYNGELVKTFLDEDVLKDIAKSTEAEYFNPENSKDLMAINNQIEKLTKTEVEGQDQSVKKEQFTYFALMTFLLWMSFIFLPDNI